MTDQPYPLLMLHGVLCAESVLCTKNAPSASRPVLELQEEDVPRDILHILDLVEPLPGDLVGPGCPGLFLAVRQDQLVEQLRAAAVSLPDNAES